MYKLKISRAMTQPGSSQAPPFTMATTPTTQPADGVLADGAVGADLGVGLDHGLSTMVGPSHLLQSSAISIIPFTSA